MSKNQQKGVENAQELITDGELCKRLRITVQTLRSHLRHGPPRVKKQSPHDIRTIRNITVGGQRRWISASVDEFING